MEGVYENEEWMQKYINHLIKDNTDNEIHEIHEINESNESNKSNESNEQQNKKTNKKQRKSRKIEINKIHGLTEEQLMLNKKEWKNLITRLELKDVILIAAKKDRRRLEIKSRNMKAGRTVKEVYNNIINSYKERITKLTIQNADLNKTVAELTLKCSKLNKINI